MKRAWQTAFVSVFIVAIVFLFFVPLFTIRTSTEAKAIGSATFWLIGLGGLEVANHYTEVA